MPGRHFVVGLLIQCVLAGFGPVAAAPATTTSQLASGCEAGQRVTVAPGGRLNVSLGVQHLPEVVRVVEENKPDEQSRCELRVGLDLLDRQGTVLKTWTSPEDCGGSDSASPWVLLRMPKADCLQCTIQLHPGLPYDQEIGKQAVPAVTCVDITKVGRLQAKAQQRPWPYRMAGHLADLLPSPTRRLLQQVQTCASLGSLVTGYVGCLPVVALAGDDRAPPPHYHFIHWTIETDQQLGDGVSFAVEVAPHFDSQHRPIFPGWAGLGWSPQGPASHPPQMINATAVIGFIDLANQPRIGPYILYSKSVLHIGEDESSFSITNSSMQITPQLHLVMRFRRPFDAVFRPGLLQRMITAHHHVFRGWIKHNHRAGLTMDLTGQGSMQVVQTRLNQTYVNAHAWSMFVAFGILLPLGIIWARYFKDIMVKWYFVHLAVQSLGLLLALAAFLVAVTQNNPIPRSLTHFQLGVAVMIIALLQPFNSIPRLTMHHTHVMRSVWWAYLHWLMGRAAVVFAWVNMFLGIGRYRTWFGLGGWADAALGCYLGGVAMVCLVLESRLWMKEDLKTREDNDELSRRIAVFEQPQDGSGLGPFPPTANKAASSTRRSHVSDEVEDDELLDQMKTGHGTRTAPSFQPSQTSDYTNGVTTDTYTDDVVYTQADAEKDGDRDFDTTDSFVNAHKAYRRR